MSLFNDFAIDDLEIDFRDRILAASRNKKQVGFLLEDSFSVLDNYFPTNFGEQMKLGPNRDTLFYRASKQVLKETCLRKSNLEVLRVITFGILPDISEFSIRIQAQQVAALSSVGLITLNTSSAPLRLENDEQNYTVFGVNPTSNILVVPRVHQGENNLVIDLVQVQGSQGFLKRGSSTAFHLGKSQGMIILFLLSRFFDFLLYFSYCIFYFLLYQLNQLNFQTLVMKQHQ